MCYIIGCRHEYRPLRPFVAAGVHGTCAGVPKSVFLVQCQGEKEEEKPALHAALGVPTARAEFAPGVHVPLAPLNTDLCMSMDGCIEHLHTAYVQKPTCTTLASTT
jgi:hypothetical protein